MLVTKRLIMTFLGYRFHRERGWCYHIVSCGSQKNLSDDEVWIATDLWGKHKGSKNSHTKIAAVILCLLFYSLWHMSLNEVFHNPTFPAVACQLCVFATQERGKHFFLTSEHINLLSWSFFYNSRRLWSLCTGLSNSPVSLSYFYY